MPKPTSAAERAPRGGVPLRVVIVTLDSHLASAADRACRTLTHEVPGLEITLHAAATWASEPARLEACKRDIATGDIIIANMLFMEDHIQAVLPALKARQEDCDAMVCCLSAGEVVRLTRLGRFRMDGPQSGIAALLKRLRGSSNKTKSDGAQQMAMLRRLPKILRFIPGTAQDVRAYFLTLQYWLAGSDDNIANMIRLLVGRYADGGRKALRGRIASQPPEEYPDVGLYHPRLASRRAHPIGERLAELPGLARGVTAKGRVGLIVMRSYVLAGNTRHYEAVIAALEAKGLEVVPAFASGLDARPAIERYFLDAHGRSTIDALLSLTGFSLVGGPAYNNSSAAADILGKLDVPYLAAHAVEFQTIEQWEGSERGLSPIEATMMIAIPELDGASGPTIFGGRSDRGEVGASRDMQPIGERVERLAGRVAQLVSLRRKARAERKLAIVLFNFPPNSGATGTAAFLAVYASLLNTLKALKASGYTVDVPASEDALRTAILEGNASRFGAGANVVHRVKTDDHVRAERWLSEIEAQWGPAPGRHQTDGATIHVLGARFGNVLVGIQPAFGYEGDPMRLLFEKGFAPTHAFTAFYTYLRQTFGADAILHFGTHGALEFMPGKQTALSEACWPDRLIGDVPNVYLYAANNPSEGAIAKRRAAATLVSYLTPPVAQAGLYRGLVELKASLERWRGQAPEMAGERAALARLIQAQAATVDLAEADPAWAGDAHEHIDRLWTDILELEYALIPQGLHIVGATPTAAERTDLIAAMDDAMPGDALGRAGIEAIVAAGAPVAEASASPAVRERAAEIARIDGLLRQETELDGLVRALDARFVQPSPSGDLVRTPDILPTGRNLHGFDPFRMPSAFAMADGMSQAERLIGRHVADGNPLPRTVAIVLWGTDNLKSEGGPIGQALALMGAAPRFDSYGRLCGARLLPLETLGRPRIDVVITLSGIFRDLLPLQTRMLAEAAYLAATADEPPHQNFVRAHALEQAARHGTDLETAALRVFSNADGAYGSNINHLIDSGCWQDEDELADAYTRRKGFAYHRSGAVSQKPELLESVLSGVSLAYQNLESVELGITTIDHYFDTLGGISRAVKKSGGAPVPVYIGDQTRGAGTVRTLSEQIALETRTRTLNPKWYEGMLKHGYEGVRQIEASVTNTVGWSATTGQVAPWVYREITETYVLDPAMRARLAALNPMASARVANRLIEAHERNYWTPDDATLSALRAAGEELEDRIEGIGVGAAA
ncbi:MAG: magnesium chelatase subunit H [Hyphomicrobiaceae bacterium]|nr:magnesium chelatase subunit H [Hyphomicrobiaceae bacterium]